MSIEGGCQYCGSFYIKPVDYNKKLERWTDKEYYLFGLIKIVTVYKEECLCYNCLPIIKNKFSINNIRKQKIKNIKC